MTAKKPSVSTSRRKSNCDCKDIKPAFTERNIPVAISTDENYLPYVKVLINSIVASTKSGNLDILILNDGLTQEKEREFLKDFKGQNGVSIRFLNIGKFVKQTALSRFEQKRYLSAAACYRLFLPDVLTAYDKIIYLDVDTSVCRDLGDLYAVDLGDNLFSAVIDVVNSSSRPDYAEWARGQGFTEWDTYVNTGVLLLNLEAFRKDRLLDRLLPIAVEASKYFCDQDALNFVCKGRILTLDPRWNVQVGKYCFKQQFAITKSEAYIWHFTGGQKTWNYIAHPFAYHWWRNVGGDAGALWRRNFGPSDAKTSGVALSVVMPVFNAELFVWKAVASVLVQWNVSGLEVICVDDGSTDGSHEILETLQRLDPRVKIIRQKNQGPGFARNAGMAAANGEYVMFLDADDYATGAVSAALEKAKSLNLDILHLNADKVTKYGDTVAQSPYLNMRYVPAKEVYDSMDAGPFAFLIGHGAPSAKLFRREFIVDNGLEFPRLTRQEDFPFVFLSLAKAKRISVMDVPVMAHRIGIDESLEGSKDVDPLAFARAEDWLLARFAEEGLDEKLCVSLRNFLMTRSHYYALRSVKSFSSFKLVAKEIMKRHRALRAEDMPASAPNDMAIMRRIDGVLATLDSGDEDALVTAFVRLRIEREAEIERAAGKCLKAQRDAARAARLEMKAQRDEAREKCDAAIAARLAVDAKLARRDEWLAAEKKKTERAEAKRAAAEAKVEAVNAKLARRDEWLAAEKKKTERAEAKRAAAEAKVEAVNAKLARRDEWLAAEKKKTERAEAKLNAEKAKVEVVNAKLARRDEWLAAEKKKTERAEAKLNAEKAKVEAANAKIVRRDEWLAGEKAKSAKLQSQLEAEKRRSADYAAENRRNGVELARLRKESQLLSKVEAAIFGEPAAAKK